MRFYQTVILVLLILFVSPTSLWAQSQHQRDAWGKYLQRVIPQALCKPGGFFLECYGLTQQTCESSLGLLTQVCYSRFKEQIPVLLKLPEDDQKWGPQIVQCASQGYDATHKGIKKTNIPQCNDPSAWK